MEEKGLRQCRSVAISSSVLQHKLCEKIVLSKTRVLYFLCNHISYWYAFEPLFLILVLL